MSESVFPVKEEKKVYDSFLKKYLDDFYWFSILNSTDITSSEKSAIKNTIDSAIADFPLDDTEYMRSFDAIENFYKENGTSVTASIYSGRMANLTVYTCAKYKGTVFIHAKGTARTTGDGNTILYIPSLSSTYTNSYLRGDGYSYDKTTNTMLNRWVFFTTGQSLRNPQICPSVINGHEIEFAIVFVY